MSAINPIHRGHFLSLMQQGFFCGGRGRLCGLDLQIRQFENL